MEGKMRQMVMAGPRKSTIIEVPIPQHDENEMLVKVTLSGMCHSEWFPWATAKEGDILGHESIGIVAEVGANVKGFQVGDRVTGLGGGAYKEYIVVSPEKMAHVPDSLKDEDAISEPLACLLSAAMKLPVETLGDTAAVVGCGYMGLGTISLFKAMGYGNIIAIDKRQEALENAKRFGATETYLPEEIPEAYISDFETIGKADLTRSGDNANVFAPGIPTVMEFTGTEDGLALAGRLVKAHGRLGIGGYHNDALRTVDFKLWNFKAFTAINCHERRIVYEAELCKRCMELLDKGIWKFTGVTKVYDTEQFDQVSEMMEHHTDGFIKAAFRP
ncbi:MAG: alcohol dehydrogenase catalytic domain-containing protein [Lachnospiraceae bacterium]|nr:alcohol dehydrogenase catalytic domain-containing protein [Lachnospiraceae bacterium]